MGTGGESQDLTSSHMLDWQDLVRTGQEGSMTKSEFGSCGQVVNTWDG